MPLDPGWFQAVIMKSTPVFWTRPGASPSPKTSMQPRLSLILPLACLLLAGCAASGPSDPAGADIEESGFKLTKTRGRNTGTNLHKLSRARRQNSPPREKPSRSRVPGMEAPVGDPSVIETPGAGPLQADARNAGPLPDAAPGAQPPAPPPFSKDPGPHTSIVPAARAGGWSPVGDFAGVRVWWRFTHGPEGEVECDFKMENSNPYPVVIFFDPTFTAASGRQDRGKSVRVTLRDGQSRTTPGGRFEAAEGKTEGLLTRPPAAGGVSDMTVAPVL